MRPLVKVAFCSGTDELNRGLVERMRALYPELRLVVVSEFAPGEWGAGEHARWVQYHVGRSMGENLARVRAALDDSRIRLAGVMLVPGVPYRRMRLIALMLSPRAFLAFNEHFGSFMLRPRSALSIARHAAWRVGNYFRWQLNPGGKWYTVAWKLARPREWRLPVAKRAARFAGLIAERKKRSLAVAELPRVDPLPPGISVVIPSRDGLELLRACLPRVTADEVIVVDNGSTDGTARALEGVRVIEVAKPLSFASAVNRGIAAARFSHVCLLNNDMLVEPGFLRELRAAFDEDAALFCATAQIFFPDGQRREETGKTVAARAGAQGLPVRCDVPLDGEDRTWVLYGSGGCSLYDTAKLRALGGISEAYAPAYCEDLDIGYRAWQRGWSSVYVACARVEHRHRSTTSRYYSPAEIEAMVERNHLRFLCRAIGDADVFKRLWNEEVTRLHAVKAIDALDFARSAPSLVAAPDGRDDARILALTNGDVCVFPGAARRGKPVVVIASPYLPYPLSHGGAVRMFNLMRRAARDVDLVLVSFATELATPPRELLDICARVVVVKHTGSHSRPASERPDVVEEFASPTFAAVLDEVCRVERPSVLQLEFTQMAQYARGEVRTVLVEHDVTFDLYEQLLATGEDWEMRRELEKWRRFETGAWGRVDRVVVMSERDRALVTTGNGVAIANGVDLERFRPSAREPEPRRLLFIGSFAHLPNLLALDFFVREIRPLLGNVTLHVIAGKRHDYFLDHYAGRVRVDLSGVELDGFVADVRPAYERAAVVIAPLIASAGTNIKIMEAMAMGKAIVATPQGVNGLDVADEVRVAATASAFAAAVEELLVSAETRRSLELRARAAAEANYDWDRIAEIQAALYRGEDGGGHIAG